jgi:hypothetical protein
MTTMGKPDPDRFRPYTAQEVAAYRQARIVDVAGTRARLVSNFPERK